MPQQVGDTAGLSQTLSLGQRVNPRRSVFLASFRHLWHELNLQGTLLTGTGVQELSLSGLENQASDCGVWTTRGFS